MILIANWNGHNFKSMLLVTAAMKVSDIDSSLTLKVPVIILPVIGFDFV